MLFYQIGASNPHIPAKIYRSGGGAPGPQDSGRPCFPGFFREGKHLKSPGAVGPRVAWTRGGGAAPGTRKKYQGYFYPWPRALCARGQALGAGGPGWHGPGGRSPPGNKGKPLG